MAEKKEATHVTVAGYGSVWVAPEGTTLPTGITEPAAPFVDIGYIGEDGAQITMSREQEEIYAWQSGDPVRVLVTQEPKTIAFELLEFDRESLELAFRGGTWGGTDPGPYTYTPPAGGGSDVRAMVIDGLDGTAQVRFLFPRVQLQGDVEFALTRTDAVRLPLEFGVLASTPSWSIVGDLAGFAAAGAFSMPRTHAELDELARTRGVTFAEGASVADKQAALEAAGTQTVAA